MKSYKTKLIEKVNSYKTYTTEEKQVLLDQINRFNDINTNAFKNTMLAIPKVLKVNRENKKKFNRVLKLAFKLERHSYAPELNKLHLRNGKAITCAGSTTLEAAVNNIVKYNYNLTL